MLHVVNDTYSPAQTFRLMGSDPRRRARLCAMDSSLDKLIAYARNHLPAPWYWRIDEKLPDGACLTRVTYRA